MSQKKKEDPNRLLRGEQVSTVGALRKALLDLPDHLPLKFTGAYGSQEDDCSVWLVSEPIAEHTCPSCKATHDAQTRRTLVIDTGLCSG